MAQQWEVQRSMGTCVTTGRAFKEGEEFYTVLFEDGDSFRRADYSLDAWQGPPEGSFCHFKSRVPIREKKRKLLVDDELLVNFFLRLSQEIAPVRVRFRFVLALILMRKRLLKYQESVAEPDGAASNTDRGRFGQNGVDTVEFLLAANPGESREPLRKVASGGEVARIMLTTVNGEITDREPHNGYLVFQGGIPEVDDFISEHWK